MYAVTQLKVGEAKREFQGLRKVTPFFFNNKENAIKYILEDGWGFQEGLYDFVILDRCWILDGGEEDALAEEPPIFFNLRGEEIKQIETPEWAKSVFSFYS